MKQRFNNNDPIINSITYFFIVENFFNLFLCRTILFTNKRSFICHLHFDNNLKERAVLIYQFFVEILLSLKSKLAPCPILRQLNNI